MTDGKQNTTDDILAIVWRLPWWKRHRFFYRMFRHSKLGMVKALWLTTRWDQE